MERIYTPTCAEVVLREDDTLVVSIGKFDAVSGHVIMSPEARFFTRDTSPRGRPVGFILDNPWAVREVFGLELYDASSCGWQEHDEPWEWIERYFTIRIVRAMRSLLPDMAYGSCVFVPVNAAELRRPERERAIFDLHIALRAGIEGGSED